MIEAVLQQIILFKLEIKFDQIEEFTLGACPRMKIYCEKTGFGYITPLLFVKYAQYSPQIMTKSISNQFSLATTLILGQAPSK